MGTQTITERIKKEGLSQQAETQNESDLLIRYSQPTSYSSWPDLLYGKDSINFWFFVGMHIFALVGLFYVPWSWKMIGLCVGSYYFRMFGITAGFHRYFSHRSYTTSRAFQFVLAIIGLCSLQKGPLWWASHHRHHHKYADQEEDAHSPTVRGFLWSHCGWFLFSDDYSDTKWNYIPDWSRYKELVWLNTNHTVPGLLYAILILFTLGFQSFFWGFIVSTVLLWHGTFFINSLAHVYGTRRYVTTDTSRNSLILALITLGEGWHNNHHTYMSSAHQGFFWWEIDVSYYILKALHKVGIVYNLRMAPLDQLESKLIVNAMKSRIAS